MKERPEIFVATKYNVSSATAIAAIRTGLRVELGTRKMLAARAAVPGFAEYPYLVYEVCFFHASGKDNSI